jgi:Uma2 family endonuclease
MTTATATERMTAAGFFDWVHRPENCGRWFELERGRVIEMPPPGERHGVVCGNISRILGNHMFQLGQGYVCTNDTGVVMETDPDTVRGIDRHLGCVGGVPGGAG